MIKLSDDVKLLFSLFIVPLLILSAVDISVQVITNDCAPKIPFCANQ